jgi:hypothetical protein
MSIIKQIESELKQQQQEFQLSIEQLGKASAEEIEST